MLVQLGPKVQSIWTDMSRPIRVIFCRQLNYQAAIEIYRFLQSDDQLQLFHLLNPLVSAQIQRKEEVMTLEDKRRIFY